MDEIKLELENAVATQIEEESRTLQEAADTLGVDVQELTVPSFEPEEKKEDSLSKFSPDEQRQIREVAEKIDITNSSHVLGYGASAQTKVSDFADGALKSVRSKDLGETGQALTALLVQIKTNSEPKKSLFGKLFGNAKSEFEALKAQYESTEANIDNLIKVLEGHEEQLVKDVIVLDRLYDKNKTYFKEVSMYIEAGKLKLEKARNEELPALQKKAEETGAVEDAQAAQDYADMITRFEKKLYDLELSRTVCLQTAPEIRMVQNSDTIMSEKIHSTIINVIPMWKTQMVLAMNNYHTQKAIDAQNAVTDTTNEMLKKNAEALHQSTVETAKASERGIVEIDTLKNTNQQLISALDEILEIQTKGKEARAAAEKELINIEQELKNKMLTVAAQAGVKTE